MISSKDQNSKTMIGFKIDKRRWKRISIDSSYLKNFSLALLNYETNRQEERFGFRRFDVGVLQQGQGKG